jgi:hypothetical protein
MQSHAVVCGLWSVVPLAPVWVRAVVVIEHAAAVFRQGFVFASPSLARNHLRKVAIRTTDARGKVVVEAYPLYPRPWLLPEVDELNDLGKRDSAAVLVQPLVHEIQLLADFDDRKDIHII